MFCQRDFKFCHILRFVTTNICITIYPLNIYYTLVNMPIEPNQKCFFIFEIFSPIIQFPLVKTLGITVNTSLATQIDKAIGALLTDLKKSGLLEETLVIWGGEFGRTPVVELPKKGSNEGKVNGRDHNHWGFTYWMAGGGIKGGTTYGATDEFGFQAVENRVHVHDLHATILHLLGFDHTKLTYRHSGRDHRLTDVHGKVVKEILA